MASKKTVFLFLILIIILFVRLNAKPVDINVCKDIVYHKINQHNQDQIFSINDISEHYNENGKTLFYLVELTPRGFMIIAGDNNLPPIIGYSFRNTIDVQDDTSIPYQAIALNISYRYKALQNLPQKIKQQRNDAWTQLIESNVVKEEMYWPNQDSTLTGGWVQVQWHQTAPYYNYCPWDMVTGARSLAGCPAIATAQIIDYFTNINNAQFGDGDDYYHSYAGRNFMIDDDYFTRGFASFPDLNGYLSSYDAHKKLDQPLTNSDKAGLCFACGVAATQVYTSSVSGTFYLSQVVDALEKFGYFGTDTIDDSDPNFWTRLSQNMMDAQPAELTVLVTGGSGGHNVVVDGYNTLNEYHVNFGWGGSYDGWYILPDEFPYSLTTIHGVTLDIYSDPVPYYDPPANLLYSSNQSPAYIDLTWQAPNQLDVISYNVYRDDMLLNTSPIYDLSYRDETAIYGTDYEYYTTALYEIGESNPSNTVVINWNVAVDEPAYLDASKSISFPNPFNPAIDGTMSIKYFTNRETLGTNIKVYNIKGEFVRGLPTLAESQGMIETTWDGKDELGNDVPSGVYFYSIYGENSQLVKILLLR
ncbi:MAG: C10 family peptidase [Candidatus Cloacimonetes bacterium]|nr:C10 family peptidase [Candidatus Cloacimonadota bacterium]